MDFGKKMGRGQYVVARGSKQRMARHEDKAAGIDKNIILSDFYHLQNFFNRTRLQASNSAQRPTYLITGVKSRAASIAKKIWPCTPEIIGHR